MRLRARLAWTTLAGLLVARNAPAGLLDSPPPSLDGGERATIVYRMGAVHFEPGGWVDTTFTCTNLGTVPAQLALEIFDENDQPTGQIARTMVAAGAGATFVTSADANVPGAVAIPGLPPIDHGKARVSASTNQLSCTAINRMRAADGTIKEAALELIKKVAY